MMRPLPGHTLAASLLHHIRCARMALRSGNLAMCNCNLSIARHLAWQLPATVCRSKARIVAGIAELQARADRQYEAMQASIDAYPPETMDFMKDYGNGRLVRRPGR